MAAVPLSELSGPEKDELVCTYAALILHDAEAEISAENMTTLIKAAGCSVDAYWPTLYSKMLGGKDIGDMLKFGGGGGGGGGAPAAGGAAAAGGDAGGAAAAAPVEEEEEEDEMEFDLFD